MAKCKFCSDLFITPVGGADFCSSSCRRNYYLTQPMPPLPGQKRCQECGKIFNFFDPDSDGEFCSDTCHILYCLFIPSSPSQGPLPPVAGPSYPRRTPAPIPMPGTPVPGPSYPRPTAAPIPMPGTPVPGPSYPRPTAAPMPSYSHKPSSSSQSNTGQITTGILVGIGVITFLAIVIGIQTTIMIAIGLTGIVITISFNH